MYPGQGHRGSESSDEKFGVQARVLFHLQHAIWAVVDDGIAPFEPSADAPRLKYFRVGNFLEADGQIVSELDRAKVDKCPLPPR